LSFAGAVHRRKTKEVHNAGTELPNGRLPVAANSRADLDPQTRAACEAALQFYHAQIKAQPALRRRLNLATTEHRPEHA
jgi:hypothetical protein